MKFTIKRTGAAVAALAASSIVLTACSSADKGGDASGSNYELADVTGQLTGEGASSQANAMNNVFSPAFAGTGATLAYNSSGSGSGQTQFIEGQVDFAGSDSPLDEEQAAAASKRCGGNEAWHLPMVIGPLAVAYHLEGVDELNLSAETIADIFDGKIKKWNDEAIAKENDGADLPDKDISVIHRSDESGTTDNFQKWLAAASDGKWTGSGKTFEGTGVGANGSTGVADQVAQTDGAITYVESGYADERDELKVARIDFGNGPVELTPETVNAALAAAKFSGEGNNLVVDSEALYSSGGAGEYPLVLTTYEIVCSAGYEGDTAALVKNFLYTALDNQEALADQGYIPVEGEFKEKLEKAVEALS